MKYVTRGLLLGSIFLFGLACLSSSGRSWGIKQMLFPSLGHAAGKLFFLGPQPALAMEEWEKEFERICSQTGEAMDLPKEELKDLVERSRKLSSMIEKLDETQKKVYMKRLNQCQELYKFMLEIREK